MASDALKTVLYKKWATENDYSLVEGKFVLPIAEAEPTDSSNWSPVVVVTAHAPYNIRVATFDAEKSKQPPLIPAPEDTGCFTFLGGGLSIPGPRVNQAGTFDWHVSGNYTFVQTRRARTSDGFVLTSFPFPLDTQAAFAQIGTQVSAGSNPVLAAAGTDARRGFYEAQSIDLTNPAWSYTAPTYLPGKLFDSSLLNGELPSNNSQS